MFKSDFKFYKRRCRPPDLSEVLDTRQIFVGDRVKIRGTHTTTDFLVHNNSLGLKPISEWKVYELINNSGLLFIPNPFTALGQRYWVCRCLRDFTCKPQKLNLDAHGDLKEGERWWEVCMKDKERGKTLLQKLRWATLGYHHNWDTKVYSEDSHDPFPEDLALLCRYVARAVGFDNFSAEAAIVNYYHMDSTLSGHTDHSEVNKEAPLLSFSFGQSAVFLLGGLTLDEKPTAMLIHSGDIVIMSGTSRLCYHGVPRILSTEDTPWNDSFDCTCRTECKKRCDNCEVVGKCNKESTYVSSDIIGACVENNFWEPFAVYLQTSRINMNVRQVLKSGVTTFKQEQNYE